MQPPASRQAGPFPSILQAQVGIPRAGAYGRRPNPPPPPASAGLQAPHPVQQGRGSIADDAHHYVELAR